MEALARRALAALLLAAITTSAQALQNDDAAGTIVYGDGWAFAVSVPNGWESDCCQRAREFHSNLLVFPHGWDGDEPDRVLLLNVWDRVRPDIDADWEADAHAYQARYPFVKLEPFAIAVKDMKCRAGVYSGSDDVRDYVVFCDPGADRGTRFSWSMSLHGAKANGGDAEAAFRYTVSSTLAMQATVKK